MNEKRLKELIKMLLANQQLINRRKVEEEFRDLNDEDVALRYGISSSLFPMFKEDYIDDSAVDIMVFGTDNIVEIVDAEDEEYKYNNYFYDIGSNNTCVLKVGFERKVGGKPAYKSGFSVYVLNHDGDDFHFIPVMRVDLEDPMENGVVIPHKNEYPANVPEGYKTFFTESEPAPHIHFFNDAVSEQYKTRNSLEGKEKNINGNAISLEHLFDYFVKLGDIEFKMGRKEPLTEEEDSIRKNSFGMPYLKYIEENRIDEYKTNADATRLAMLVSFDDPMIKRKINKELDFAEGELSGIYALMFDMKYAMLLADMLKMDKLKGQHGAIKTALTDILTKTSMQLCDNELEIEDRQLETYGIYSEKSWGDRSAQEIAEVLSQYV